MLCLQTVHPMGTEGVHTTQTVLEKEPLLVLGMDIREFIELRYAQSRSAGLGVNLEIAGVLVPE